MDNTLTDSPMPSVIDNDGPPPPWYQNVFGAMCEVLLIAPDDPDVLSFQARWASACSSLDTFGHLVWRLPHGEFTIDDMRAWQHWKRHAMECHAALHPARE